MTTIDALTTSVKEILGDKVQEILVAADEITLEVTPAALRAVCQLLRDDKTFAFDMLIDISGVDYLNYGVSEWLTEKATGSGFERAVDVERDIQMNVWTKPRFAAVYHLLSLKHNHRLRVRCFVAEESPLIPSVIDIWPSANWYEREAFDLYGIIFDGHPDLRRILTDYGFIGHPFRKDFPLIGNVEMRYDATQQRVVYEPVSIMPRTLVPKVIRRDTTQEIQPSPPAPAPTQGKS